MIRILGPGLGGLLFLGFWIYCVFDVIATEEMLVRNLPKTLWLLLVLFVPTVGGLAWLLLGRPVNAGWRPGDTELRPPPQRPRGPEDDPDWRPPSRD